jgi:hypothetical protein
MRDLNRSVPGRQVRSGATVAANTQTRPTRTQAPGEHLGSDRMDAIKGRTLFYYFQRACRPYFLHYVI